MNFSRRSLMQKSAASALGLSLPNNIAPLALANRIHAETGFSTPDEWRNIYEKRWGRIGTQPKSAIEFVVHAKGGLYDDQQSPFAWIVHYWLRAWIKLADMTGDEKYLLTGISYIDYMLEHTDEKRVARGEISENYLREPLGLQGKGVGGPFWKRWEEVNVLNTGMITHGIMRFCDGIFENRERWPAYVLIAEKYVEEVKRAVNAFDADWKNKGESGTYYYRDSAGFNTLGNTSVSFNQAATMCATQLYLDKWEKDVSRREKARRLCRFWADKYAHMQDDGTLHWAYRINSDDPIDGKEDAGHATVDLDFLFLAYELGISEITDKHVHAIARTFKQNIWRPDGSLNEFVDGSTSSNYDEHFNAGFGWFELSKYDDEILPMVLKTYHKFYHHMTKAQDIWARPMLGWVNLLSSVHAKP